MGCVMITEHVDSAFWILPLYDSSKMQDKRLAFHWLRDQNHSMTPIDHYSESPDFMPTHVQRSEFHWWGWAL